MENNILWVARDSNGELFIYSEKPIRDYDCFIYQNNDDLNACMLPDNLYPEVTFENSPKQLIIKED